MTPLLPVIPFIIPAESRNPFYPHLDARPWMQAFAGMTNEKIDPSSHEARGAMHPGDKGPE
jgi:hypothetical protein